MGVQSIRLQDFISKELASVADVEAVWTSQQGHVFHVWTLVDNPDQEIRRRIYDHECAIIDQFDDYEFEFNIIPRRGRDAQSVLSDPSLELTFSRV